MKKAKKVIALLLAVVILSTSFTAFAGNKVTTYTSPSGKYTMEKISHKNSGVKEADGLIDFESGDADRGQNYAWSAVGYGDYVYVGTCYAAIWQTLKIMAGQFGIDQDLFKAIVDAAFNGALYTGDEKNNPTDANRAVLVKIHAKTGETKVIYQPEKSGGFRGATTFNGKLYFIGTGAIPFIVEVDPETDEYKRVYEADPITVPGMASGIRGITEINGKLAVSMIGDNGAYIVASENPSAGKESFKVIATQEDLFDYPANMFNDNIFGGSIFDMASLNGKLYISIVTGRSNKKQAFALVCGEEQKDGTFKYHVIAGDEKDGAKYPFGFSADRSGAANLVVFDNHLYIGGYNDPMVALPQALSMNFEPLYKDLSSPVNLWRMDTDENVELVAGEPNDIFPEVVGNMGSGFGNNLNQYVWRMQVYDGKLYVGTFDIGSLAYPVMQFTNGDILERTPEEWKQQIEYIQKVIELAKKGEVESPQTRAISQEELAKLVEMLKDLYDKGGFNDIQSTEDLLEALKKLKAFYESIKDQLPPEIVEVIDGLLSQITIEKLEYFLKTCEYLSKGERGFDLLVTEDGKNFEVLTRDGFGDPYNHGLRSFGVTNYGLCIGTANPFLGAQVWRLNEVKDTSKPGTSDPNENVDTPDIPDTGSNDSDIANSVRNYIFAIGAVFVTAAPWLLRKKQQWEVENEAK